MKRVMISPSKYVQGEDELYNLGNYVKQFSDKALLVASKIDQVRVQAQLNEAVKKDAFEIFYGEFREECTRNEIERMRKLAEEEGCGVFIGLGGGKALDTAKAASFLSKKPVIIVPTIASTDAPTSKLSIIYTESGEFEEYFHLDKNPDLVLVDTAVIAKAPTRFLVAGMGDALSTYFEARSCIRSGADNMPGGKSTKAAFAIARTCYETLMAESLKAKAANDMKVVTQALEDIIEANILLSGLGFESSGLAAAHSIHNGLTILEETHGYMHGEKVSFGVIVHLVLENAPQKELDKIIGYCKSVGLPTCLKDLGIVEVTEKKIMAVAKAVCAEGETIHNMPFPVTPDIVYSAILVANRLGR
ncbi:MAG: glycerol dehydrogenase [Clostridia bacterium]|nr:glycerol dehydrogenase [Clostridia bacterium]